MSLAIVEVQQGQQRRPVSGCVGVLFLHLLDWNRRLARKNRKSRRINGLLPPILKRFPAKPSPSSSSCPKSPLLPPPPSNPASVSGGGGSGSAHLIIPEEPQMSSSTTRMQSPGLVARLMGLESMPISRSNKPQKDPHTQIQSSNTTQPGNDVCSDATRPLKMQKTSNSNSSGDLVIHSAPRNLKKYYNKSNCLLVRSPRARLIQAASKILEPGLRPKLSLSPLNSSVRNMEENVIVGSLIEAKKTDVDNMLSGNEMEPPKVDLPDKNGNSDVLDNAVQGRKCARVQQKATDSVVFNRNIEINRAARRNGNEQRKVAKNTALIPVAAGKVLPKTKISGASLNKRATDKPFAVGNSANAANRKRRTGSDYKKKTDQVPFGGGTSSNTKAYPKRDSNVKKRECNNNRASSSSSVPTSRLKSVPRRSMVNKVTNQRFSCEKEGMKLKECAGSLISSILDDLVLEVSREAGNCASARSTPCCEASQGEKDSGLSTYLATLEGDQPSPISILEASFSNDSCSLGSPVDESDCNMLFGPTGAIRKLPEYDFLDISTETTPKNSDLQILGSRVGSASGVISNIELLFSHNQKKEKENFSIHGFLLNILKNLMEIFDGGFLNGERESCRLTNFLFDCIMEFLDCKYGCFCESGYRNWLMISQSLNKDQIFREILKEVRRWSEIGGKALYVLADRDMENSIGIWSKCGFEGFEVGVEIENAIIQMLVEDLLFDLC